MLPPFKDVAVKTTRVFLQMELAEEVIIIKGETNCLTDITSGELVAKEEVTHERLDVMEQVIISPLFNELSV